MTTIEERAKEYLSYERDFLGRNPSDNMVCRAYVEGATEQKAIDHSEEHLNWIIKQHYLWSYEMCHCDNNECCTFKEWIDKAMEE